MYFRFCLKFVMIKLRIKFEYSDLDTNLNFQTKKIILKTLSERCEKMTQVNEKQLLQGNTAIARGAYEAGVEFAAAYPGTPSSEIPVELGKYEEIDVQWSANEKVAFDEAMGAAIAGKRSMAIMKYVGVNVAADPFMVFPYGGTTGGFVLVSCDDPGMHSSQNEQDNRYFAKMAKVPMIEPSDGQEGKEFLKVAFDISEKFGLPALFRSTMRISHTKFNVGNFTERVQVEQKQYEPDIPNWVVPVFAKNKRVHLDEKFAKLEEFAEECELNVIEEGTSNIGVVTSGAAYQYAKEILPDAHIFKLGLTWPLPKQRLADFCSKFDKVYVLEEQEAFLEEHLRIWGITNVVGKEVFPSSGELSAELVDHVLNGAEKITDYSDEFSIIQRPPQLCAGCPHRGMYYALKKNKTFVTGDIGCYTLGCLPPLSAMHTSFCMGSSIGNGFGFDKAGMEKVVGIIGDSTFIHGGIPSLIDVVYNKSNMVTVILDNSTTGMTGHQDHPATGYTLKGEETHAIDLEQLVRACGVQSLQVVDPYDLTACDKAVKEALAFDGPAVIITKRPCALTDEVKKQPKTPRAVDDENCIDCGACHKLGCPSISKTGDLTKIDYNTCIGCTMCEQVCKPDAIAAITK